MNGTQILIVRKKGERGRMGKSDRGFLWSVSTIQGPPCINLQPSLDQDSVKPWRRASKQYSVAFPIILEFCSVSHDTAGRERKHNIRTVSSLTDWKENLSYLWERNLSVSMHPYCIIYIFLFHILSFPHLLCIYFRHCDSRFGELMVQIDQRNSKTKSRLRFLVLYKWKMSSLNVLLPAFLKSNHSSSH